LAIRAAIAEIVFQPSAIAGFGDEVSQSPLPDAFDPGKQHGMPQAPGCQLVTNRFQDWAVAQKSIKWHWTFPMLRP
jgi:hypothetical protein